MKRPVRSLSGQTLNPTTTVLRRDTQRQQRRRPCENRGRDSSDAATNQEHPEPLLKNNEHL